MRSLWLLVLLVTASCAHAPGPPPSTTLLPPHEVMNLPQPENLVTTVTSIVEAHRRCTFPLDVRTAVPLGIDGAGSWDGAETDACLGALNVVEWSVETASMVAIHLLSVDAPDGDPRQRLVMFGHFVDGTWKFSWPTGTGPSL